MADLMNGRVGDQVLVNGRKSRSSPYSRGPVGAFGYSTRRMLVSCAWTFGDAPMTIIGRRRRLLAAPVQGATEILLSPGGTGRSGGWHSKKAGSFALKDAPLRSWLDGAGNAPNDGDLTLMSVEGTRSSFERKLPASPRSSTADSRRLAEPTVRRRFVFGESMGGPGGMTMVFMINGKTFDRTRVDVEMRGGQDRALGNPETRPDMGSFPSTSMARKFQVIEVERKKSHLEAGLSSLEGYDQCGPR